MWDDFSGAIWQILPLIVKKRICILRYISLAEIEDNNEKMYVTGRFSA